MPRTWTSIGRGAEPLAWVVLISLFIAVGVVRAQSEGDGPVNYTPFAKYATKHSTDPVQTRPASNHRVSAETLGQQDAAADGKTKADRDKKTSDLTPVLFPGFVKRFPLRWQQRWGRAERALDQRLDGLFAYAKEKLPASREPALQAAHRWLAVPDHRELALLASSALTLLLLLGLTRLFGKPGDLKVELEYPAELHGRFDVYVRKRRVGRSQSKLRYPIKSRERASTKLEHYQVSRDTHFHGLRVRRYWVTVEGVLEDSNSGNILKTLREERSIYVRGGRSNRIDFDFQPGGCPVEVSVKWDKRVARDASVSLFGQPYTLRYVRRGAVRIEVPLGIHRIVVGGGDRVAEIELDLSSYLPRFIEVDLGKSEHIVFKGCPPAVEPYLQGDIGSAARALEQEGQEALAHRLLARLCKETGQVERAAEHFEAAGDLEKAAELYVATNAPLQAARLWLATGLPDLSQRGIALLEGVQPSARHYRGAGKLLAALYESAGHSEEAENKLEELLRMADGGEEWGDLQLHLAQLLEDRGECAQALEMLEEAHRRDPNLPNLVSRIEGLRKQVEKEAYVSGLGKASEGGPLLALGKAASLTGSRYDILEQIGRGGMGVVFKARDRKLGRLVALKQLPEELREHPKAIQLFLSEARAVAVLNHPNIVTLYDADQEGEKFFITMELLEGRPLGHILRKRGRIASRDCARVGLQVAAGLYYAHSKRIVHRDIKVSNLFYTHDKVVKIMDFGIAKVIEEVRRGTTVVGGTPSYMAPEQTLGRSVDARADLYAFGVTLFEMLTGTLPFTEGDVAYHHCHTPAPDARSLVPEIPEAFSALIQKMMEKDPARRFANAAEIAKRLRPLAV